MSTENNENEQYVPKLVERRPITLILEKPTFLEKEFTSRDQVMNDLGLTRERLIGEAARYALLHGKNTNFVELEAPIEEIESNLDMVLKKDISAEEEDPEVTHAIGMFVDRALEVTTDAIIETHSVISELPEVVKLHDTIRTMYGKDFDLVLKEVKLEESINLIKIELDLEREIAAK